MCARAHAWMHRRCAPCSRAPRAKEERRRRGLGKGNGCRNPGTRSHANAHAHNTHTHSTQHTTYTHARTHVSTHRPHVFIFRLPRSAHARPSTRPTFPTTMPSVLLTHPPPYRLDAPARVGRRTRRSWPWACTGAARSSTSLTASPLAPSTNVGVASETPRLVPLPLLLKPVR